jgi:sensor histidine kinase YesM
MVLLKLIKEKFMNWGLYRKLLAIYTIVIILPITVIGSYTYHLSKMNMQNEIIGNSSRILLQVKENMEYQVVTAEKINEKITYNQMFQQFLSDNFSLDIDSLEFYTMRIVPLVEILKQLNQVNVHGITIYTNNPTIPERLGSIYYEGRIRKDPWYKQLIKSKSQSAWISRKVPTLNPDQTVIDYNMVFTYVKKIQTIYGKYLGVVAVDILQEDMYSAVSQLYKQKEDVLALDTDGTVVFPKNGSHDGPSSGIKAYKEYFKKDSGSFVHEGGIFVFETIKPLGVKIVLTKKMDEAWKTYGSGTRVFIVLIIFCSSILILITYLLLRVTYRGIVQITKQMNKVAEGHFDYRIPVKSKDELGKITEDFNVLIDKINQLVNEIVHKETFQKDAQIAALQHQINPHMIYNTIDIFRMRSELEGNYETADGLASFGDMLRYNLNMRSRFSTIRDEIGNAQSYIRLQRIRYGEKLQLKVILPQEIMDTKVLKFILQPVVENSIKHGFDGKSKALEITIEAEDEGEDIKIRIVDNGRGINLEKLESLNSGFQNARMNDTFNGGEREIGLANINMRLLLFYGNSYYIRLDSEYGKYTMVIITVPKKYIEG